MPPFQPLGSFDIAAATTVAALNDRANMAAVATNPAFVRERQTFWSRYFQAWSPADILVRPENLYPPYGSVREMMQARIWSQWDAQTNRYGVTNVIAARNAANVHTEAVVDQLMHQLEELFSNGRFGGQNRDWLRRGLETAGRLGMVGAAGGPYVAVACAVAGFVASAVQDLWPGRKQELLDTWRGILRDCTTVERYLLCPYMRSIFVACVHMDPGYNYPDQPVTDPWRWGNQPQPFGHNIVGAGSVGIATFLGEILFEFDWAPPPAQVPIPAGVIESARQAAQIEEHLGGGTVARAYYDTVARTGATIADPLYCQYVAAILCADHPPNFYCRDVAHRQAIYGNPADARGSAWIKTILWPRMTGRKVGDLKAEASAAGIEGMSPTFYTHDIDRILVDSELHHGT